jgi:lysophospholipase L1-like esterase
MVDSAVVPKTMLRILPLGASITWGWGSTDNNGYRSELGKQLLTSTYSVHFVGTQHSGSMVNNANEGYPGKRIEEVAAIMDSALGYYPNVVLIHLGTNDCAQNFDVANAHNRMGQLVDKIFARIPKVTIIVSKILPNGNGNTNNNIKIFNDNLNAMVAARPGRKLQLVDMYTPFSLADISDGTHPTDAGYIKMASSYAKSVFAAGSLITAPKDSGISDFNNGISTNTKCQKTLGVQFGPTLIQQAAAAGASDGTHYCDMTGRGSDDYIWMSTDGILYLYSNTHSPPSWNFGGVIHPGVGAARPYIHLADLDNDKKCDYLVIESATGAVRMIKNNGLVNGKFDWVDKGIVFRGGACPPPNKITFADLNGDGKADIACVYPYVFQLRYILCGR